MTPRIILASDFYPPFIGGSELMTQLLAEELADRGHAVTVATVWHRGLPETETIRGVTVRRLRGLTMRLSWAYAAPLERRYHPPFPDPLIAIGLHQLIRDFRPDVVDASGWIAYSARLATAISGIPLVLSAYSFGYACPIHTLIKGGQICAGPAYEKCLRHAAERYGTAKAGVSVLGVLGLRRWLIDGTATLHVLSRYMVDLERRDLLPADGPPIAVIPVIMVRPVAPLARSDGPDRAQAEIDDDLTGPTTHRPRLDGNDPSIDEATRRTLERLPREPYILFVGALQSHKGIGPMLAAYRRLRSAPPLVIVGTTWPDSPSEWPPGVIVMTNVPNTVVHNIWSRSMFGIAPSLVPETFGGVVLEAMQHSRPIIASDIGGPLDTVLDGQTGFLVPPGDIDALTAAMQALVDDPGLRERMGAQGRDHVHRHYGTEVVIPHYEQLYARVAATRTTGL